MQDNLTVHEIYLCDMLTRKMKGLPVEYKTASGDWNLSRAMVIDMDKQHRIPSKQSVIPWDVICDDINYVAMDSDKGVYGYECKPTMGDVGWLFGKGDYYSLSALKIDIKDVDWITSLVERPKQTA